MGIRAFSPSKMHSIIVAERSGSILSIIGSAFIIVSFLFLSGFRKPINRLIFLASFGNILASTATMFSTAALDLSPEGKPSPVCRTQGFLIQAFIPSDALWAACMAWNVYITFFKRYTPKMLQKLELRYTAICYGGPLTLACVYLIVDTRTSKPIYGPATIWCWVTRDYDWMRLAFFYGPVLFIISITCVLYLSVFLKFVRTNARALGTIESSTLPLYNLGISFVNPQLNEFSEIQAVTNIDVTTEVKRNKSADDSFASTSPLTTHVEQPGGVTDDPQMHTTVIYGGQILSPAQQAAKNARTYLLTAALVWFVLLVVWIPSTINRVQGMLSPRDPNFGMNLAAAIVLPLQGLGNSIIYCVASRHEIKSLFCKKG